MNRAQRTLALTVASTATLFASSCASGRPDVVAVHEVVEPFVVYEMTFVTCPVQGVEIIDGMRFEFPPLEPQAPDEGGAATEGASAVDELPGGAASEEPPGPAETTADWGFHLAVHPEWIDWAVGALGLVEGPNNAVEAQEAGHRLRAPIVLGLDLPAPLEAYDHYGDGTDVAYVHLFVHREPREDGRHEIYVSKH